MPNIELDDFCTGFSPEEYDEGYDFFDAEMYLEECKEAKKEIFEIYQKCIMSKKELEEKSIEDLAMGTGFLSDVAFSISRLNESRTKIVRIIDLLYIGNDYTDVDFLEMDSKMDCGSMGYKDGELCPYVDEEAEKLTQLGTALGLVSILEKPESFTDEGTLYAVRSEDTGKINCKKSNGNS